MNKSKIYLETSFISYLTSKPSRDIITSAHQQISLEWWKKKQKKFDLFISQLVFEEASKGNPELAKKRLEILSNIPILELNKDIYGLANRFIEAKIVPRKVFEDALHISIATFHGLDYLLNGIVNILLMQLSEIK